MRNIELLNKYKHFKGNEYLVLCKSTFLNVLDYYHLQGKEFKVNHTETENTFFIKQGNDNNYYHTGFKEDLIVYIGLYNNFVLYARPFIMFASEVDKVKYPNSTQRYRFEIVQA